MRPYRAMGLCVNVNAMVTGSISTFTQDFVYLKLLQWINYKFVIIYFFINKENFRIFLLFTLQVFTCFQIS